MIHLLSYMTVKTLNLQLWSQPTFALEKEHIQFWLESLHEGDRSWLATALGSSSKSTVDQYFSTRGFSDTAIAGIKNLMRLDHLEAQASLSTPAADETAMIPMTTGQFERVEQARSLVGNPPRPQFYANAIEEYVDRLLDHDPSLAHPTPEERQQMAARGYSWALNETPSPTAHKYGPTTTPNPRFDRSILRPPTSHH